MVYLFGKPPKRAFRICMGRGGVGDHIFEKIARDCTHLGQKRLFRCRAGCTDCTCIPVHAEFRKNVVP